MPDGVPDKPDWLKEVGGAVWDQVVFDLANSTLNLATVDGHALAMYCLAWERLHEARKLIDDEGIVTEGSQGNTVVHPAVKIEQDSMAKIERWGAKFGLTPSDRFGLKMETEAKENSVPQRVRK